MVRRRRGRRRREEREGEALEGAMLVDVVEEARKLMTWVMARIQLDMMASGSLDGAESLSYVQRLIRKRVVRV